MSQHVTHHLRSSLPQILAQVLFFYNPIKNLNLLIIESKNYLHKIVKSYLLDSPQTRFKLSLIFILRKSTSIDIPGLFISGVPTPKS